MGNSIVMNIFTSKNRIVNFLSQSIILASIFFAILYIFSIIGIELNGNIEFLYSLIWCCIIGGFIGSSYFKNSQKSSYLVLSLVICNSFLYLISNRGLGIFICIVLLVFFTKIIDLVDSKISFICLIIVSIIFGILLGLLTKPYDVFLNFIAIRIENLGYAFGAINELFCLFFGNDFSNMFYHQDYGISTFINGKIVTGVIDAFSSNIDNPNSVTALYLTGKYYANIFLPLGSFIGLYKRINKNMIIPLACALALSIICGNNILFSLFLLLYNPFIYVGFLLATALCYLCSYLVDIRIGFNSSASIIEMIMYHNDMLFFLLIGLVAIGLMYFVTRYALSKYDMNNAVYFSKEAKELIDALGGEGNIHSLDNTGIYVINPNLINLLKVDCDIKGNRVTLMENEIEILSKYY